MLGRADPVGVDRAHVLGIRLAAPLEQEALGGRFALLDDLRRDPIGVAAGDPERLRRNREQCRREPAEILAGDVIGDVDELAEIPVGTERGGDRLQVGRRVARQAGVLARLGDRQPGLEALVHEQSPDLLEGAAADELLDVDAAVAERPALAIGLRDLRLEGDDAFQARLEVVHVVAALTG